VDGADFPDGIGQVMIGVVVVAWRQPPRLGPTALSSKTSFTAPFDAARLDIEIKDRFEQPVIPREWYFVPLFVIDEAVERIKDGTITSYVYDPKAAALVTPAKQPDG
jgi:hypothetical protein